MHNRIQIMLAGAIAIAAVACGPSSAGSPPSPVIPPEGTTEPPKPISTGPGVWKLQPSSIERFYLTTSDVRLKLTDSSTIAEDAINTRAEFKISSLRETRSFLISATINTFTSEGGSRTGASTTSFSLPLSITARSQNNRLLFTIPGSTTGVDCTNPAFSTLSVIQRAVIAPPFDLHTGMTWNDTTTADLCSGGIPVVVRSVRNYRVLGEAVIANLPVILLERHETGSSAGEGSNGQHRIMVQTETTGSGQIAIDRLTGSLVDDLSTYMSSITIRSSGRGRIFTQTVKEHTTLK
jgi:hypothetical protein